MPYSITWSPTARITYFNILEYVENKWTHREVEAFANQTERVLELIKQNPSLYQYSKKSDTHKFVLTKQVSLFYRVKKREIELILFWNNRQDPDKLNLGG